MNKIDLHNHSIVSLDGQYKSEELINIAINSGIKVFSIADHDETSSLKSAEDYSKKKDITFIPGIEISGIVESVPIHILGYNIDYHNLDFVNRSQEVRKAVLLWAPKAIEMAHKIGFEFEDEKVYQYREDGLTCEEYIGQTILEDHRNDDNELLLPFRNGGRLSDNPTFNFYREFYATGKPCYVKYDFNMDIAQASELIHDNNGKMFLAHPNHNIKKDEELLEKIISYGLDGIEVFSSYHDLEATKYYYQKAKEHNLFMSVGSDFHGHSKPAIKIGSVDYDEEELEKTIKFILNI